MRYGRPINHGCGRSRSYKDVDELNVMGTVKLFWIVVPAVSPYRSDFNGYCCHITLQNVLEVHHGLIFFIIGCTHDLCKEVISVCCG